MWNAQNMTGHNKTDVAMFYNIAVCQQNGRPWIEMEQNGICPETEVPIPRMTTPDTSLVISITFGIPLKPINDMSTLFHASKAQMNCQINNVLKLKQGID